MTRTLDAVLKHDELQSRCSVRATRDKLVRRRAARAQVALEFRATDGMLGLERRSSEDVVARLADGGPGGAARGGRRSASTRPRASSGAHAHGRR